MNGLNLLYDFSYVKEYNKKVLEDNPTCEKCHKNNSVAITPFGKIEAACQECIDNIWFDYNESVRISKETNEKYGYD